jgi:hypothetical protein
MYMRVSDPLMVKEKKSYIQNILEVAPSSSPLSPFTVEETQRLQNRGTRLWTKSGDGDVTPLNPYYFCPPCHCSSHLRY